MTNVNTNSWKKDIVHVAQINVLVLIICQLLLVFGPSVAINSRVGAFGGVVRWSWQCRVTVTYLLSSSPTSDERHFTLSQSYLALYKNNKPPGQISLSHQGTSNLESVFGKGIYAANQLPALSKVAHYPCAPPQFDYRASSHTLHDAHHVGSSSSPPRTIRATDIEHSLRSRYNRFTRSIPDWSSNSQAFPSL